MMTKLLVALDTCLYLTTNYNVRFEGLFVISSSNFAWLPLLDDMLAKVILQCEIFNEPNDTNYPFYEAVWLTK